jgi:hypothetical protein
MAVRPKLITRSRYLSVIKCADFAAESFFLSLKSERNLLRGRRRIEHDGIVKTAAINNFGNECSPL